MRARAAAVAAAVLAAIVALALFVYLLRAYSHPSPGGATFVTTTPIVTHVTSAYGGGAAGASPSLLQLSEEVVEGDNLTLSYGAGYTPVDMSSLWGNLTLANSSSVTISRYIEWLSEALSPGNDSLYNFTFGEVDVQPPQPGVPVRYGAFNLPFGAQVVVFAYPSQSGLVFVLDGRVANQTAWLQALAMVVLGVQAPNGFYSPAIDGLGGVPAPFYTYINESLHEWPAPVYTSYTLWRVQLDTGEYAVYKGQQVPVTVVVLLEEPIYTYNTTQVNLSTFWSAADLAYWDVVGAPTLALAVNIEYAGVPMPQVLYEAVPTILWDTLHIGYSYGPGGQPLPRFDFTPFIIQYIGVGVCEDQSYATASFMADALGAASAIVWSGYYAHGVSLLVFPPQFAQEGVEYYGGDNVINLTKYNVSGAVIDNTDPDITARMMQETVDWLYTRVFYPFSDSTPDEFTPTNQQEANAMLYTGIPEALYQLPPLFQFPWTRYYVQGFNLTYLGQQYEQQFAQMVKVGTNLTGVKLVGFYIPSNISEWTFADYYQFTLGGLYQELELGNGIVQAPSLSYLP